MIKTLWGLQPTGDSLPLKRRRSNPCGKVSDVQKRRRQSARTAKPLQAMTGLPTKSLNTRMGLKFSGHEYQGETKNGLTTVVLLKCHINAFVAANS
jgi:hypothetical protein